MSFALIIMVRSDVMFTHLPSGFIFLLVVSQKALVGQKVLVLLWTFPSPVHKTSNKKSLIKNYWDIQQWKCQYSNIVFFILLLRSKAQILPISSASFLFFFYNKIIFISINQYIYHLCQFTWDDKSSFSFPNELISSVYILLSIFFNRCILYAYVCFIWIHTLKVISL